MARDLEIGGSVIPQGASLDDPIAFNVPTKPKCELASHDNDGGPLVQWLPSLAKSACSIPNLTLFRPVSACRAQPLYASAAALTLGWNP
jgi:hypothetical protein